MTASPLDAVAVVGMAGRFPGARDVDEFWDKTTSGTCSVTRRTDTTGGLLWARGELDDVESFDAGFFGISSREALLLDPQHRLLLECAWEALADADPEWREAPRRRTAVFAGANYSGYRELLHEFGPDAGVVEFESATDKDFLATRLAYRLKLEGPSMTVQTACSTSLVAVHLACQSLLEYDADVALAGGVSVVLPHAPGWGYEPRTIHSGDGVCRPFDLRANGTVMGDGVALVALRRLADAVEAGCRIYAVILGSAVNNDGARKAGFAAPSAAGQEEVIRAAHRRAAIGPASIGYVETHGTGTPLGDRIELLALGKVFAGSGGRCTLGSVKGAIGHLDTAAGIVGLIRSCLSVYHGILPGTVNHERLPDDVDLDGTPLSVGGPAAPWEGGDVRRAGVSSFGVGGTNAHVVLEEHRGVLRVPRSRPALRESGYRSQRFWPDVSKPGTPVRTEAAADRRVEYRRAVWREVPPDPHGTWERSAYQRIVLLSDRDATGAALGDALTSLGAPVICEQAVEDDQPGSGRMLVVCAFALTDVADPRRAYDALTTMAGTWCSGRSRADACDVVLLTHGVYTVLGDEHGDAGLAAVSGLARSLSIEAPSLRVRVIDVQEVSAPALVDVAREALAWRDEPLVVRRGRRWWRRDYESLSFTDPPDSHDGVAVVLGVGQIGSAAARVLAQAGRTVVLVTRPSPGDHSTALARELGWSGSRIAVEECDVADPRALEALLARVSNRYGTIDELVHAAGISGEAAYEDSRYLPAWQHEQHFDIKIDGVTAIGNAARRHAVRRVVLMSSLAGVLGAISLGPYAAAAAASDAFAERFDSRETRWLSVAWDAWARDDADASARETRMTEDGLTATEGSAALRNVLLADRSGHILVTKGCFTRRWDRFVREPLRRVIEPAAVTGAHRATSDMLQLVLDGWRTCLALATLDADDNLIDLGADSLMWIDVLADVEAHVGATVPMDLLFEAPTPRLLAERIGALVAEPRSQPRRDVVRVWGNVGPSVWCLHPIGGGVDGFSEFADVLGGRMVRAVAGAPLAEVTEEAIEDLAERYCALLDAGEPPAALIGWSFGAIVAFQVAHTMVRRTGVSPPLVIVDMPAPTVPSTRSIADVGDAEIFAAIMSHHARESGRTWDVNAEWLRNTPDEHALAGLLDQLHVSEIVPATFTSEQARRLATGYRRRLGAVERCRPTLYPGRVVVLRAAEAEFGDTALLHGVLIAPDDDPTWGWQGLSPRGVDVVVVDGHHATLFQKPAVDVVGDIVRAVVAEASDR